MPENDIHVHFQTVKTHQFYFLIKFVERSEKKNVVWDLPQNLQAQRCTHMEL